MGSTYLPFEMLTINMKVFLVLIKLFLDCGKVCCSPAKRMEVDRRHCFSDQEEHRMIVEQFFEKRKTWRTSNLGTVLYKNIEPTIFNSRRKFFNVMLWQFSKEMKARYTFRKHDKDVLDGCSVNNCAFFDNPYALAFCDVIVVHMNKGPLPTSNQTSKIRRWILLNDDPPYLQVTRKSYHGFYCIGDMKNLGNMFNWTMTYRSDSDIPVPYGRTIPLKKPLSINKYAEEYALAKLVPHWDEKQMVVLATAVITECKVNENHQRLLQELSQYIKIDVQDLCHVHKYLEAGRNNCTKPGCQPSKEHIFFIALETVSCRQFLSEKIFSYAYAVGSIPVIMGPTLEDCEKLLPPGSFLHVDFFKSTRELTIKILDVASSSKNILAYHLWRKHFIVTNEHGYFGSRAAHYCRICEGLNYNDGGTSVYDTDDLRVFFDEKLTCDLEYNGLADNSKDKNDSVPKRY